MSAANKGRSSDLVQSLVYARHGRDCCGVQVPCTSLGVLRRSAYQMIALIGKVLEEGNCRRVTDCGEEACECVRKCRPDFAVGYTLFKAARLRTETSYKAGSGSVHTGTDRRLVGEAVPRRPFRYMTSLRSEASRSYPGRLAEAACVSSMLR